MRSTRSQGRPGTAVIPSDWQASHGTVTAKTMTAVVALRKPGTTKTWSDPDEQMVPTPFDPYSAEQPARIQALRATAARQDVEAAEESVHVAGYLVTITFDRPTEEEPERGHLIDVTTSDDPLLTGRTLRVVDVVRGSLRFERDLFCTLDD